MAKQLELDMTSQEKLDFVQNLQSGSAKLVPFYQKSIRRNNISTAIALVAGIIFGLIIEINMAIYVPILVVLTAVAYCATFFASFNALNVVLKKASNGKINYSAYKKLVKSGELDRWLSGDVEE